MASLIAARRGSITRILKPYYSSSYACLFSSHTSRNPNLELGTNPSIPSSAPPRAAFNRSLNFAGAGGLGAALVKKARFSSATRGSEEPESDLVRELARLTVLVKIKGMLNSIHSKLRVSMVVLLTGYGGAAWESYLNPGSLEAATYGVCYFGPTVIGVLATRRYLEMSKLDDLRQDPNHYVLLRRTNIVALCYVIIAAVPVVGIARRLVGLLAE